jgi:hypothetical protein
LLQENTIHNAISRGENLHTLGRAALLEEKTDLVPDAMARATAIQCGSWLAGDSGLTFNTGAGCQSVIAGKPGSHKGSAVAG